MARKRITGPGVQWHLPDGKGGYRRRPFAATTSASANLVRLLAGDGLTWAELVDEIRFDDEALTVARGFVEAGYGDAFASDHVG